MTGLLDLKIGGIAFLFCQNDHFVYVLGHGFVHRVVGFFPDQFLGEA